MIKILKIEINRAQKKEANQNHNEIILDDKFLYNCLTLIEIHVRMKNSDIQTDKNKYYQ